MLCSTIGFRLVAAMLVTLATSSVFAASWLKTSTSNIQIASIDRSSLKVNGDFRTIWVKFVYKKRQTTSSKPAYHYDQEVDYISYNCLTKMSAMLQCILYEKGQSVYSSSYDEGATFEPIIPDTSGEIIYNTVCALDVAPSAVTQAPTSTSG